jgi:hypothetical protein
MNTINQPASPAPQPVNWIIIAVVGVIGCVCMLAVGLALGLGLGGKFALPMLSTPVPIFTPTAPATSTALPTDIPTAIPTSTETPVPLPTATFTMAPTQELSSIVEALRAAAEGRGVEDAAAYDQTKPGVHPIVIVAPSDEVDEWNSSLPVSWRSLSVSQTELVVLVTYTNVTLERKQFFGKGFNMWVSTVRIDSEVILREAKTGRTVSSIVFTGGDPPALPNHFDHIPPSVFYGTSVAYETVQLWLKDFVEP